jgi:hypothetical protein
MKLYVGLSYSNPQHSYGIPCYISGIVIEERKLSELTSKFIEQSEKFLKHTENIDELKDRYQKILPFLDNYILISTNVGQSNDWITAISYMYIEALSYLTHNEQTLLKNDLVISYHGILKVPGFVFEDITEETKQRFRSIGSLAEKDSDDYAIQIARFLAKAEYSINSAKKSEVISKKIVKNPKNCIHFYKMSYHREYPDDFDDNFVGLPELLFKRSESNPYRQALKVNKTRLNLKPLAKFCKGIREDGCLKPCIFSSKERLYGNLVFGSEERCTACKKLSKHAECLIDKPTCDGYEVACKNTNFAGEICNGEFGVYVTRYCNALKVGKAVLSNLISRLLDQGANSALMIYPILNIHRCYQIEHQLKDYLQSRLGDIGNQITEVTLFSPKSAVKTMDFLENWYRNDKELLSNLSHIVDASSIKVDGNEIDFSSFEKRVNIFLSNYKQPPFSETKELIHPPNKISGKMVGI